LRLADRTYRVEVAPRNGAIRSLLDRTTGADLIAEPRLADSFRLLLPLPGRRANYIAGSAQRLTSARRQGDGLLLRWNGPLRSGSGRYDVSVEMRITLAEGGLRFECDVENRTGLPLAEVWYPILGGLRGLGGPAHRAATRVLIPFGYAQEVRELFRDSGACECLGITGAERNYDYPGQMSMSWASLYNPEADAGFYFAAHDPLARRKTLRFAIEPGVAHQRAGGDWLRPDETAGRPLGVTLHWAFFPYTTRGVFRGPPVVLHRHGGNWRESAALYRQWYRRTFPVVDSRSHWVRRETATLDTMFLLPEDVVNLTFKDIPRWGRDARTYGVRTLMISGWHRGGHDRGYPDYTPDPRLGTWNDLAAGLRACHRLGLKVLFFVNYQWADMSGPWYRRHGARATVRDPYGCPKYGPCGWGMGTLGARSGLTQPPLVQVSPGLASVRRLFVRQMRKLAEIGADGVHVDKLIPAYLDFNDGLDWPPDQANTEGCLRAMREMAAECRKVNPAFCITREGWMDRFMEIADVIWWHPTPTQAVFKAVFPEYAPTIGVTQPGDYNVVNHAVLRGWNLLIGPGHYTRGMDYAPMRDLFRYIRAVQAIRRRLHDLLSRGQFLESSEPPFDRPRPAVRLGGRSDCEELQWSLFRDVRTGRRAIVLVNLGPQVRRVTSLRVAGAAGFCRLYEPGRHPGRARLPLALRLPPERLAVVTVEAR
jgi:hypothetical protein